MENFDFINLIYSGIDSIKLHENFHRIFKTITFCFSILLIYLYSLKRVLLTTFRWDFFYFTFSPMGGIIFQRVYEKR